MSRLPHATPSDHTQGSRTYSPAFYDRHLLGSRRSATLVLEAMAAAGVPRPSAVVDVGCGSGAWLDACGAAGSQVLVGLDGPWNRMRYAARSDVSFLPIDLQKGSAAELKAATGDTTFDLGISVEVVEHLPDASGRAVVEFLAKSCRHVLFSAAIPGQGGTDHRNERWQSYWAAAFGAFGLVPYDIVRPRVWANEDVDFWYRQNLIVYARPDCLVDLQPADPQFLDLVHPQQLGHSRTTLGALEATQVLGQVLRRSVAGAVRSVLGR